MHLDIAIRRLKFGDQVSDLVPLFATNERRQHCFQQPNTYAILAPGHVRPGMWYIWGTLAVAGQPILLETLAPFSI
jgi:hypothetical protein